MSTPKNTTAPQKSKLAASFEAAQDNLAKEAAKTPAEKEADAKFLRFMQDSFRNIASAPQETVDQMMERKKKPAPPVDAIADDDAGPVEAAEYVPFPVDALPEPMRDLVVDGAAALGCDPAQIAVPALAAASAAIGNSRRITLKASWAEPAALWTVTILPSGALKSPALDLALEPIRKAQHDAIKTYQADCIKHETDKAEWEAQNKNMRGAEPIPPKCARITVNDITVEALASRLADAPRGLLCERDELAGWLKAFNQYKSKGGSDEAHWLTMHRAGSLLVDRKTGEQKMTYIPRAFVALTGTIQPGVFRRAISAEYRESGLLSRLLLTAPPVMRRKWTEAVVNDAVKHAYSSMLGGLIRMPMGGEAIDPAPVDVPLSRDAKKLWIKFYNFHNAAEQAMEGGDISSAWSKLEGYAARLALIVHCCRAVSEGMEGDGVDAVDAQSMAAGIIMVKWFAGEAERAYAMLGGDAQTDEQSNLLAYIHNRGGRISARELKEGRSKYRPAGAARDALLKLAEAGHGRMIFLPTAENGGRQIEVFEAKSPVPKPPRLNGGTGGTSTDTPAGWGENGGCSTDTAGTAPQNGRSGTASDDDGPIPQDDRDGEVIQSETLQDWGTV